MLCWLAAEHLGKDEKDKVLGSQRSILRSRLARAERSPLLLFSAPAPSTQSLVDVAVWSTPGATADTTGLQWLCALPREPWLVTGAVVLGSTVPELSPSHLVYSNAEFANQDGFHRGLGLDSSKVASFSSASAASLQLPDVSDSPSRIQWRFKAGFKFPHTRELAGVAAVMSDPDTLVVATGCLGGRVTLWKMSNSSLPLTLEPFAIRQIDELRLRSEAAVSCMALSFDARWLVWGDIAGTLFVADASVVVKPADGTAPQMLVSGLRVLELRELRDRRMPAEVFVSSVCFSGQQPESGADQLEFDAVVFAGYSDGWRRRIVRR